MVTLNAHNITNHIKRFILHELSEIILEPLTIFIFDENQQLLIHHSTDNHKILPDTSAHKTITEVNNEILNKKDFSFYSNQFFIHADLAYHIGILIKGEINTAKTYIHLLTEIISQSIKDIKQQNQLDKTEQFTFAIMNAVNFAVLSTNSSGKIIYANDHCCRILDIRRTELLDYSIEKLIPTWNDIIKMVNQGNDVSNKETTISTPSDSLKFNLNFFYFFYFFIIILFILFFIFIFFFLFFYFFLFLFLFFIIFLYFFYIFFFLFFIFFFFFNFFLFFYIFFLFFFFLFYLFFFFLFFFFLLFFIFYIFLRLLIPMVLK